MIKLKCWEYNPIEKTVDNISYEPCNMLQLASNSFPAKGQLILPSYRQLHALSLEWPKDSTVSRILNPSHSYVMWARYVLQAHKDLHSSLRIYIWLWENTHFLGSWVAEFWYTENNTCWISAEELFISLWELQTVSRLPVFGCHYKEYVPPDERTLPKITCSRWEHARRIYVTIDLPDAVIILLVNV